MRILVIKFVSVATIALVFASCSNNVPELPTPEDVAGYKYCKYTNKNGYDLCESTYKISEEDCKLIGKLFYDAGCTDPWP